MYKVIKQTIENDNVIHEEEFMNLPYELDTIKTFVIPKLHKLSKTDNLRYVFIKSNKRIQYLIYKIDSVDLETIAYHINEKITSNIRKYNHFIINHNNIIKRGNKQGISTTELADTIDEFDIRVTASNVEDIYTIDKNGTIIVL